MSTKKTLILSTVALIIICTALVINTSAHIVKEQPWHPLPASYLRSVFYLNLKPVNWDLVEKEYSSQVESGYDYGSVYEILDQITKFSSTNYQAEIKAAISSKNKEQVYQVTTDALSNYIRFLLSKAEENIDNPSKASLYISNSKELYRAFEKFIQKYDEQNYVILGKAWLNMNTSLGSRGVLGAAERKPDIATFTKSKKAIEDYLIANYEKSVRKKVLIPIPLGVDKSVTKKSDLNWLPPGTNLNDQVPLPRLVLNFEERGHDEKDLFLVAYGDMLFDSKEIFGSPANDLGIACSKCHNRSDINKSFFIPGISHKPGSIDVDGQFFNPLFNDHRNDSIDIPSLRGIRFTAPYGRDGRFASLRDFVRNVIVNEFGGAEPTPLMLDALVTYMLEFDWLPSQYLNPDGTLNENASKQAKRGEILFNKKFDSMGGRACSSCHIPSSNFIDGLRHDIGSGNASSPNARDSFFDTPTLINVKYTAPYFHDGSLENLSDVVQWFDNKYKLKLNEKEKSDLTAYLDEVGTGEEPFENFDYENTQFTLDWSELSTFLSTLNTLIPAEDKFHIALLLNTVSKDLKFDAAGLKNLDQSSLVYELTDKLDNILDAVEKNDWQTSASLWLEYKELENKYGPKFK
ncbi:MAG: cytochrome C [Candidatus Dadabacteria bacterium]|nr:cytochrome C [Candidatus Dadabacteria bacterium]NIV42107.1 cytochrome C [Candidatus Dadabacteria bacterium]NIX16436.1 cytochrome C [Candidatus Dadabacteria bacterium]